MAVGLSFDMSLLTKSVWICTTEEDGVKSDTGIARLLVVLQTVVVQMAVAWSKL